MDTIFQVSEDDDKASDADEPIPVSKPQKAGKHHIPSAGKTKGDEVLSEAEEFMLPFQITPKAAALSDVSS